MPKSMAIHYQSLKNLATSHGQMLEDEQAKVSALQIEREARERVIELLHGENVEEALAAQQL